MTLLNMEVKGGQKATLFYVQPIDTTKCNPGTFRL